MASAKPKNRFRSFSPLELLGGARRNPHPPPTSSIPTFFTIFIPSEGFYSEKSVRTKDGFADLVTATDERVEEHVISTLRSRFPDHAFIGEETTASGKKARLTDDPTWIIDPVGKW